MARALSRILFFGGRRGLGIALGLLVVAITALYVPAALAFPHRAQFNHTTVYSEAPIPAEMGVRLRRADRLLSKSPLYEPSLRRTLVLTGGGWRWRVMSVGYSDAVALRRPFSSLLVFNRSDIAADRVSNRFRSLSGTIAHETVHVLTARRFGELRLARMPRWKREGYADYVAQEPSIGADDEARMRAKRPDSPVLAYHEGRRRVAAELARNGGSVDTLLAAAP